MPLSTTAALNKDRKTAAKFPTPRRFGARPSRMTHQHFAVIASIIAEMPDFALTLRTQKRSCAHQFAEKLASTNPNFDSSRFLRACNLREEPE